MKSVPTVFVVLPFMVAYVLLVLGLLHLGLRRQRARMADLRSSIEAQVRLEVTLTALRVARPSSFTRSGPLWLGQRGPAHLKIGADAFLVSAPRSFREYGFSGRDCFISRSQDPSSPFVRRDWIVITGLGITPQGSGRTAQLAIAHKNLPEIWRALAEAGGVPY
jgi:hypothetical protein